MLKIDHLYEIETIQEKRKVVGSIFPEKWIFDGIEDRTIWINEAAGLIYAVDEGLLGIKNGTSRLYFDLSHMVTPEGLEPSAR